MSTTRIVVGVDGSSESKTALDWAIDLARDTDAGVIAVHATEIALSSMVPSDTSPGLRRSAAAARAGRAGRLVSGARRRRHSLGGGDPRRGTRSRAHRGGGRRRRPNHRRRSAWRGRISPPPARERRLPPLAHRSAFRGRPVDEVRAVGHDDVLKVRVGVHRLHVRDGAEPHHRSAVEVVVLIAAFSGVAWFCS